MLRVERHADHVVVHGWAAPGATATTIGRVIFVRRGAVLGPRLYRHELEHVAQYRRFGLVGFFRRYLPDYLRWRLRGHGHKGAYRRIALEVAAEWRARRALGIGVVAVPPPRRPG